MSYRVSSLKWIAAATMMVSAGVAQASITVYTTESSFMSAVVNAATDTFDDLLPATGYTGPLSRSAGSYGYTASAGPTSPILYGAGSSGDAWLSTNNATDTITFDGFSSNIYAAGAFFFNSDIAGSFLQRGAVVVTATDTSGTETKFKIFATTSNYFGFVSDTALTSLTVRAVGKNATVWPTVNDLTLAAAVPEPETYMMMLGGLAALGFMARRRRRVD
jgi:hypothetical protein